MNNIDNRFQQLVSTNDFIDHEIIAIAPAVKDDQSTRENNQLCSYLVCLICNQQNVIEMLS